VIGTADIGTKGVGVCGQIYYINSGAAIFGSTQGGYMNCSFDDIYAGYFDGNVKVIGNLSANTINGITLGPATSGSGSSIGTLRSASVANSLSGLNVTTYQNERPEQPTPTESTHALDSDTLLRGEAPEPDVMDEQFYEKNHYALDADRLEEVYPDLVYVRKDGSKAINYMEMIPLLVQSINELNAEIEILKGQTQDGAVKAARTVTSVEGTSLPNNVLYQNSPNPFKEQTTIRFSLADDVTSAAICIFDMTGKMLKKLPVSSGDSSVKVNGWELGEGMFLYTLLVNGQEIDTKRMIITK
jgi:hypothetical protein